MKASRQIGHIAHGDLRKSVRFIDFKYNYAHEEATEPTIQGDDG